MFTATNFMFLICESPLHAGSGSELDFIDNPIQRERHTQFPKIESSSLKGAIRERFLPLVTLVAAITPSTATIPPTPPIPTNKDLFAAAFGAESKQPATGDERQGGLAFTDARLLLFPVKSMKGVFAWITCPFVLNRMEADIKRTGASFSLPAESGKYTPEEGKAIVFSNKLDISTGLPTNQTYHIILEEYSFLKENADTELVIAGKKLNEWFADKIFPQPDSKYWNDQLKTNLVILSDNDFADFCEMSTEVITRNQIDTAKGTVKKGHLFTEEYLPADSVLYTVVMTHGEFIEEKKLNGRERIKEAQIMSFFKDNMNGADKFNNAFQAGGNATIGKGLIRTAFAN